jgi:hypothetical protein
LKWIQKLEELCKFKKSATDETLEVVTTNYSALYLGQWYRENGCDDEANACFRPFLRKALILLSDEDPNNDLNGFGILAVSLLAAGNDESALAVLHAWRPQLKNEAQMTRHEEELEVKRAKEQLKKAVAEEKGKETMKKTIEEWQRDQQASETAPDKNSNQNVDEEYKDANWANTAESTTRSDVTGTKGGEEAEEDDITNEKDEKDNVHEAIAVSKALGEMVNHNESSFPN